ncbi:Ser/Thr protein phosphatase [Magnaporthiopsis poae ATCC 64411]|uniref:Ser/Thr protein phosphatase n=1 Tax=Magnaporthiopsis poae (strain ATCC 64411 / 73-15) TaxID=644358 RepID=A0A0C4DK22_MAGP6|nr:Ser/Thr protein phosphatase [Magnaporthiopsis poae ATCC 64411]
MDGSDIKRYGDRTKETARSPMLRRTRFVCVSDTHNHAVKLPKGDVLIHAGDLTNQGTSSELIKAVQWLEKAEFEAKIVIAGNHDVTLDADFYKEYGIYFHNQRPESPPECLDLLESSPSIIYLAHSAVKVRLGSSSGPHTEFTVFGSPYSPRDGLWAFSYPRPVPQSPSLPGPDEAQKYKTRTGSRSRSRRRGSGSKSASHQRCEQRPVPPALESVPAEQLQPTPDGNPDSTGDVVAAIAAQPGSRRHSDRPTEPDLPGPSAEEIWAKIPLSADVVVTHGPPRGHRDEAADRRRSAGCEALRCRLWRVRPRLAVCGHVHERQGRRSCALGHRGRARVRQRQVHGGPWCSPAVGRPGSCCQPWRRQGRRRGS